MEPHEDGHDRGVRELGARRAELIAQRTDRERRLAEEAEHLHLEGSELVPAAHGRKILQR